MRFKNASQRKAVMSKIRSFKTNNMTAKAERVKKGVYDVSVKGIKSKDKVRIYGSINEVKFWLKSRYDEQGHRRI